MSSMRAMHPLDLLGLEKVNLDPLTETYHIGFYLEYLAKWPHLCRVIVGRDGEVEAYSKSISFCILASSWEQGRGCGSRLGLDDQE